MKCFDTARPCQNIGEICSVFRFSSNTYKQFQQATSSGEEEGIYCEILQSVMGSFPTAATDDENKLETFSINITQISYNEAIKVN